MSEKYGVRRSFGEELSIWWAWVSEAPMARINDVVGFSMRKGWMPKSSIYLLLAVAVQVLLLVPLLFVAETFSFANVAFCVAVLGIIVAFCIYEYVAWKHSRFVFYMMMPMGLLAATIVTAILIY